MNPPVGIRSIGTYFPARTESAAEVASQTGIPEDILQSKMGIRQRHVASAAETVSMMATHAAQVALRTAALAPEDINLVISHGSEHKDHLVWNVAAKIQHNIGAIKAYAFEMYALCAGAPIALDMARAMMLADDRLHNVLLVAASRENELLNYQNQRSRFMFNFGAGGGAMLLQRGAGHNLLLGSAAFTDGSLSEAVVLTEAAVGDGPPFIGEVRGRLDVTDSAYMAERLGETSLSNFLKVITEAVERSNQSLSDVRFLGITHMKRSFHLQILESIGLAPEQSVYLEDYGHIQSVDQALAVRLGLAQGKIQPGDLIVLAGAGTGYTWSAIAIRWG